MSDEESALAVLGDIARIHDERVRIYKEVLKNAKHVENDVRAILERMIEESIRHRQQLTMKLSNPNGKQGRVYKAWTGVRVSADTGDKKAILAACANDELALMNVYSLSLSFAAVEGDTRELLDSQKQGVNKLYIHIKQFHDAQ
jgi:hypothetical protein